MVASVGTILIAPGDGDMREYLAQLERLASLDAQTALPAHGDPIPEPSRMFEHYVAHRLARERKVADALAAAGPSGAEPEELVPVAYDDTPRAIWSLAAMSLRAHLIKLEQEGRARSRGSRYTSLS
jgi:glyoxylase-like metal-dependent hydrolase (beta-lactamase superfamily II)